MYWLRWHYHVKDIAGAPYKIKKKERKKENMCSVQCLSVYHIRLLDQNE